MSDDRNYAHGRLMKAANTIQVSPAQKTAAYYLLDDLMAVARQHGAQLSDFDAFADLPTACLKIAATLDLPAVK